jgi:hypothetical protein
MYMQWLRRNEARKDDGGFKSYATRAFRAKASYQRDRFWADHGSTRYLWNEMSLKAAVEYVLDGQGRRMECFRYRI